jgi:acyl carrier protein
MSQPINVLELFAQAAWEVDNRKLTGLTRETVISALGMDSLATMELVALFEEKLSLRIPDEQLSRIRTVGDLRDAIAELVPAGTEVIA